MTKEELEKEIKNYIDKNCKQWETDGLTVDDIVRIAVLDFAEPREKRISGLEGNVAYYAERAKHAELDGRDYVLKYKDLGKRCLQLQKDKGNLTDKVRELEQQTEKMKCCKEEIIKALKETFDYAWLPAHNGKAKFVYLQTVIDIVIEKFEEIKEK